MAGSTAPRKRTPAARKREPAARRRPQAVRPPPKNTVTTAQAKELAAGEQITFNPDTWEMGDLEDFEEQTGLLFDEAVIRLPMKNIKGETVTDDRGRPIKILRMAARTMTVITWIEKRRTDPNFTLEQARKVKATALVLDEGDDDGDPKDAQNAPDTSTDSSSEHSSAPSTTTPRKKSAS